MFGMTAIFAFKFISSEQRMRVTRELIFISFIFLNYALID